jgi:sterol desaturase/sphingolipid hydroxylase (fatty acid hydroxylase superfamily)
VRPIVPPAIFVPVILLTAVVGFERLAAAEAVLGLAGGYVFWTLCEYWIHRSLFHLEPSGAVGSRIHYIIHGVHHEHPNDPLRLVMPPVVTVPAAAAFFGLFVLALGTPLAFPVTAGFFSGYLIYDLVHYALHHARPKGRVGRWFHQLHMRHHFEDEERGYGVSAPYWDFVFRTASSRATTPRPRR